MCVVLLKNWNGRSLSHTHTHARALEMNDCLVNAAAAQANIAEAPSLTSNTQQAINAKRVTY